MANTNKHFRNFSQEQLTELSEESVKWVEFATEHIQKGYIPYTGALVVPSNWKTSFDLCIGVA